MRIPHTVWRLLAVAWTIVMLVGCLTPHSQIPSEINTWNDKSLHVLIFAPFTLLWMLTGLRTGYALAAGLLFGLLIETLQYALPINRSADWKDVVADCIGAALGAGLAIFWQRFFPNNLS